MAAIQEFRIELARSAENGRGEGRIESEWLFRRLLWSSLIIAFVAFALPLANDQSLHALSLWASGYTRQGRIDIAMSTMAKQLAISGPRVLPVVPKPRDPFFSAR